MGRAKTKELWRDLSRARTSDITVSLGAESIDYPGDTPYSRELIWTIEEGGVCDLSKLMMSTHSGTHLDAPAHFVPGGKTIDQYAVTDFVFPATVIEVESSGCIVLEDLPDLTPRPGSALLFKTENSTSGRVRSALFTEEFVSLGGEVAGQCAKWELGLVGIDFITIESFDDKSFPAHRALLGAGMLVLEGIDLAEVEPGDYTLLCAPLKIHGGEASPVRAVLID